MSASKTQNYQLHAWAPGDDFLREEFNENFARLDQLHDKVAYGVYTGDDQPERVIPLPFTPRVVMVTTRDSLVRYCRGCCGGLVVAGAPLQNTGSNSSATALSICEGGFTVYRGTNPDDGPSSNYKYLTFRYFALA